MLQALLGYIRCDGFFEDASHPKDRRWCSITRRANMLAIGSHSLVCMEETNGSARSATTMVVSG